MDIESWYKPNMVAYYIQAPPDTDISLVISQLIFRHYPNGGEHMDCVSYKRSFWFNTTGAKIAVYKDWKCSHMKDDVFVSFIDYNKHWMNIRHGSSLNEYDLVIITSTEKLSDIYPNIRGEYRVMWERRLKVVDLYHDNDAF